MTDDETVCLNALMTFKRRRHYSGWTIALEHGIKGKEKDYDRALESLWGKYPFVLKHPKYKGFYWIDVRVLVKDWFDARTPATRLNEFEQAQATSTNYVDQLEAAGMI